MIGRKFANYEIAGLLGKGAMGEVYRARDTRLKRDAALKFPTAKLKRDPRFRQRFLREARSAAAIDHPYACKTYEVGEAGGLDFIAMEYVEGETLAEHLKKGPLPPERAIRVVSEIAEALAKAHSLHIIHRDLKPSNIMLCPDGHVKVMDFGLAKQVLQPDYGPEQETLIALTQAGSLIGTPGYMSPEQARGESLGPTSDIFSLGIIFHESLSGQNPFQRTDMASCLAAILSDDPRALPAELNSTLGDVLGRMLAKNPSARYPSATELLAELQQLKADRIRPPGRMAKHSRMVLFAVLVLVAVPGIGALLRGGFKGRVDKIDMVEMQARDYEDRAELLMQNFSDPEDLRLSIESWEKVLELRGESAPDLAGLAMARAQLAWNSAPDPEMLGAAQREAERAIQLEPGTAGSYPALVLVFVMKGLFDSAEQMSRKSMEVAPDDPLVLQVRARFLMDFKGNYAEAEQLAAKATRIAPEYYPAWFQLGWGQMELGRTSQAKASFRTAIDLRPNFAASYLGLGICFMDEKRFGDAKEIFDKALGVDRNSIQAQFYQGVCYHYLASPAQSLASFRRVVESNPDHPLSHHGLLNMAVEYRTLGQEAECDSALNRAEKEFKKAPHVGWALEGLAGVSAVRGHPKESLAWLNKAVADGFRSALQLRLEPALASLEGDPGLQEILNGISTPRQAE